VSIKACNEFGLQINPKAVYAGDRETNSKHRAKKETLVILKGRFVFI